ncbi:Yhc1p TDEL_0G03770 [Torulaspora delbrueckii]|uniref:Matrin-type domain-containing protein n=1 Tax=Torulaspora delbrueckii TaxID=4950 RepID=G8ZXX7_TORDE|nr:hypothetical protein TDEL_0G03770 [Torulaspora delbrueckii]CCE93744.1 hypothetical protein TDEL_0G03770 [Torulaspora delbrueckii]
MARYYCEYCHSYLTHDTLSVRKSHLVGKNHLRIVADYYRNKAHQEHPTRRRQHGKHSTNEPIKIHLPVNREKRRTNSLARCHRKELLQEESLLKRVYEGSPGYSKVFVDSNRLDIGDLVRSSRLPQRANVDTHQTRSRNETFTSPTQQPLEPPRLLARWQTTAPKATYHEERLLQGTLNEAKQRLSRKRKN